VAPLVDVPRVEPYYISDVAFSADEAAIVTNGRRTYRLSEPATATRLDESKCGGVVGQSNIGIVRSRDNRIVVLLLNNKEAPIRLGGNSVGHLSQAICGAEWVVVLGTPANWPHAEAAFVSFSPNDDRLAVIHVDEGGGRWPLTLIEIWDTGRFSRLAAFPIRGLVGYRIGWSPDRHRLAVVRSGSDGTRIYEIP
jgi:hypothetical protein